MNKISQPGDGQNIWRNVGGDLRVRGEGIQRTASFWIRAVKIYGSYKVCQYHASREPDISLQQQLWDAQHERAADAVYRLCVELRGFFLKSGQFLSKPDLVPPAWVNRLSALHDASPADAFTTVKETVERDLGGRLDDIFEYFDESPVGSASIAQVHKARLRKSRQVVAVKVQHPGSEAIMLSDLAHQKKLAGFLQRFELGLDLHSIITELQKQVKDEFDFRLEAESMAQIGVSLGGGALKVKRKWTLGRRKAFVMVPQPIAGLVTKRVLVMDYIDGVPISDMPEELRRRGIDSNGRFAQSRKRKILDDLMMAYGLMILRDGKFQADPHPGNIFICKGNKVALLDYGQTKTICPAMRLGLAHLVVAMNDGDMQSVETNFKGLGIEMTKGPKEAPTSFRKLATIMLDTRLTGEYNPFADTASIKDNPIKTLHGDLILVLKSIQLLRAIAFNVNINVSLMEKWRPIALEVIKKAEATRK